MVGKLPVNGFDIREWKRQAEMPSAERKPKAKPKAKAKGGKKRAKKPKACDHE